MKVGEEGEAMSGRSFFGPFEKQLLKPFLWNLDSCFEPFSHFALL